MVRGIPILRSAWGEIGKKIILNEHKPFIKILQISSVIEQNLVEDWKLCLLCYGILSFYDVHSYLLFSFR